MGKILSGATSMSCPHGGTVTPSATAIAKFDGSPGLLVSDSCSISGCSFQIPVGAGTKPSPCMTVQWSVPASSCRSGAPLLTTDSVGLCMTAESVPQGSVSISSNQGKVSGT